MTHPYLPGNLPKDGDGDERTSGRGAATLREGPCRR